MAVRHFANTFVPWLGISFQKVQGGGGSWLPVTFFFFFKRLMHLALRSGLLSPSLLNAEVLHSAWGWTRSLVWTQSYWVSYKGPQCCCVCVTSSGGSIVKESMWKLFFLSVGVYCPESLLWRAVEDCLFHMVRSSLCVCGWNMGRECGNCKHLGTFLQLAWQTSKDSHDTWGKAQKLRKKKKEVRDGFFSGKVILWIYSQSVLIKKCPSLC